MSFPHAVTRYNPVFLAKQKRTSSICQFNPTNFITITFNFHILYNKNLKFKFLDQKVVLSFVPKSVIYKYVENDKLKKVIKQLIKEKKLVRPLNYKKDKNLKRKLWLFVRDINYIKKYKNNEW